MSDITKSSRTQAKKFGKSSVLTLLVIFLVSAAPTRAQCPMNTMTSFERIGGVNVKDSHLTLLYSAPNSTGNTNSIGLRDQQVAAARMPGIPITAECNNRCRRNARCRAFLVDYARHICYAIEQSPMALSLSVNNGGLLPSPPRINLVPTQDRTAYFEKHCFNLPGLDCERAWIFERVLNHQIQGHDDKIIEDVPTRIKCQELCMNEREFKCRSGEYDYLAMQCRLSLIDRHTKPKLFRPTSQNVDYFENQCVNLGQQCDAFDRFDNMDLGRAEIVRSANSSEQCQQFCTQTIKAFICRSFTWSPMSGKCYLNSANTFTVGGLDRLQNVPGLTYYQRNDCFDLQLDCDHTAMTLNLRTNEPFRGRMYVRDDPMACETIGRSSLSSSLMIPFQSHARCATRELVNRFSSVVVVQQHPLIQRKSDRYIKLVCDFQTANKTVTSTYNVVANPWTSTALINATSFAPKIRLRITDRYNSDVVGAKLGDELYLNIEAETESVYDMVARSVIAKSGGAEAESIMLIDKDGCPTDPRIFPSLKKMNRRTIRGKFDAFKFSTDVVVRFQVDVQFCLNQCPVNVCDTNVPNSLSLNSVGDLSNGPDIYSAGSFTQTGGSSMQTTSSPQPDSTNGDSSATSGQNILATVPFNGQRMPTSDINQQSIVPAPNGTGLSSPSSIVYGAASRPGNLDKSYLQSFTNSPSSSDPSMATRNHQNHQFPSMPANQPANFTGSSIGGLLSNSFGPGALTTTSPGDPQVFEPRSAFVNSHSSLIEGSSSLGRRTDGNILRRKRRSAEPIPMLPSHVPLQGEIIIRDRDEPPKRDLVRPQHRQRNGRKEQTGPTYELNGKFK